MSTLIDFKKILCLSPHPDDIELSMSGTIMKCSETFFDVLCLTMGSQGDPSSSDLRRKEVHTFWKGVANVNLFFSDVDFSSQKDEEDWIKYLDSFIHDKEYDCIAIPSNLDSHYEHVFFYNIALAALRSHPISCISYRTVSSLSSWSSNFLVDISDFYTRKVESLNLAFKSQVNHPYFDEKVLNTFHRNYQSHKRGMQYTECFKVENLYHRI